MLFDITAVDCRYSVAAGEHPHGGGGVLPRAHLSGWGGSSQREEAAAVGAGRCGSLPTSRIASLVRAARVATTSGSLSLAWSWAIMVDMGLAAVSAAKSLPSLPFFHLGPGKSMS